MLDFTQQWQSAGVWLLYIQLQTAFVVYMLNVHIICNARSVRGLQLFWITVLVASQTHTYAVLSIFGL